MSVYKCLNIYINSLGTGTLYIQSLLYFIMFQIATIAADVGDE